MPGPNDSAEVTLDIGAAVEAIGADLGFGEASDDQDDEGSELDTQGEEGGEQEQKEEGDEAAVVNDKDDKTAQQSSAKPDDQQQPATTTREPPKSWAKEMHAHWQTLTPEVQDYFQKREQQFHEGLEQYRGAAQYAKSIADIVAPYRSVLQSQNLTEDRAIATLMRAHVALTTGAPESRKAALEKLAQNMGYTLGEATNGPPATPSATEQELQRRLAALESDRQQQLAAEQARMAAEYDAQVKTFAADPANVHFNEVAHDMRRFIEAGVEDLAAAYEMAVWSNTVTRAKEIAALQTQWRADFEKEAQSKAQKAQKGAAQNVRDIESRTAPTEPKGKFLSQSSMEADLAEIKRRQR